MTLDEYFSGFVEARGIFDVFCAKVGAASLVELRVTKSQVAFRRRRGFAWMWIPGKYLRGCVAALVLTLAFQYRHPSPRWKEIVEPLPGRFVHHIELHPVVDIDDELCRWFQEAWEAAA